MQTIGYNTNAGTNFTASGYLGAVRFLAPASGDANPGTMYIYCYYATTQGHLKLGVWADDSNYPGALLASVTNPITCPSSLAWESDSITWTGIVGGNYYWLGFIGENVATQRTRYNTNGAANQARYRADTGYTLPDPFTAGATGAAAQFSCYIEYTETASGLIVPIGAVSDAMISSPGAALRVGARRLPPGLCRSKVFPQRRRDVSFPLAA